MDNDSVINSRAGDVFHYRWATRRCLKMINPKSKIKYIMIEGSNEPTLHGELVMDVTEYSESGDGNGEDIAYFQLKHSVKRLDKCFELSELKDTIEGFAHRFSDYENSNAANLGTVKFFVITNRPISTTFKEGILAIRKGVAADKRLQNTLEKYTHLKDEALQRFCASLELVDDEGNYADQKHELHFEMAKFFADAVEHTAINNIIALVQEQVLPNAKRKIVREDVLKRFGVTNKDELFPAPPQFETLNHPIKREQHTDLLDAIIQASTPIIITAGGGVGKSVVCCQLAKSLPNGSVGIVYDCFGAGKYRNRSETRHQCNEALVQIANELAVLGLCEPLMPQGSDKALLKAFLNRLSSAGKTLQQSNKNSILAIFIDAADNAEMAAQEFSESCFVHLLLREPLPTGCRIIALCRPERDHLLQLANTVQKIELSAFSETETLSHLRKHFPNSSEHDALEFHRLTGGNPRVQANALSFNIGSISKVLSSFGPSGMTVDDQIAAQLNSAIAALKENHTQSFQPQIDSICLGLANLHPFIPVEVLAAAAEVDAATVKSFVADLGRPLWLSDNSVQFRDEPTETWFRKTFSASSEQIASYVIRLKPLAAQFPYVAGVLPSLLLQSGNYTELICLALSDDALPEDSPIDKRNVRVYRLQFAFKAALKQKRYADAAKLSLRAGEEVAGDNRQLELLSKNTDLIAPLQSAQRVQELAFRRMLRGVWDGSENAYSAALLSTVDDFKGEARSYLRAAENWLRMYFEERETSTDNDHHEQLKDKDIVELASARLNLFGAKTAVDFIQSWKPPEVIFRIARLFIRRLVDAGKFAAIDEIAQLGCRNVYFMLAVADELMTVGKFPPNEALRPCLVLLTHKRTRIKKIESHWGEDRITPAVASFAEACTGTGLCHTKILRVLKYYLPQRASNSVTSEHGREDERNAFLRGVALKAALANEFEPDFEILMPKEWLERKNNYDKEQDITQFKQVVGGLLPWHILRARMLTSDKDNFDFLLRNADKQSGQARAQRYREYDHLPFEISRLRFEVLALNPEITDSALNDFVTQLSDEKFRFPIHQRLSAARAAFRLEHLSGIKNQLECSCYEVITSAKDEQPETIADWYIDLARAVLATNPTDAKIYFDEAVEAVSKFGDELVERWEAVVAAAKRTAESEHVLPETAYRFIRCTELVGDYVAKEKYFSRNEAVEVCLKLHPESAFAALSRWRDRDIGWLDRQLPALAHEAVQSKTIAPSVAWSLSAFSWEYDFAEFAALCIENETDAVRRQYILDTAVKDLRLENTAEATWQKINSVAQRFSLKNAELQHVLTFYAEHPKTNDEEKTDLHPARNYYRENLQPIDWTAVFANLDLTVSSGLSHAINRFDTMSAPRSHEEFWSEIYKRVPESEASIFLDVIVNAENADYYDVERGLSLFPAAWREKVSVQRAWPKIIKSIARRFAPEYANYYRANSLLRCICLEPNKLAWINEGILEGLSDSCHLVSASTLFGFTNVVSSYINPQEAADLLDFALSRFELHIDKNQYADGPWTDRMVPPDSITDAFTGFVWSALASPRSEIRWRTVHCVRRLAEAGCEAEIDALINWMNQDKVDAFGSHKYPLYNLHARQYLLIAMARVAIDSPDLFRKHHAIFVQHALAGILHALIQKYASEIALSIETAFPGTYDRDTINRLRQIGSSPFPIKKIEGYGNTLKSPWHMQEKVDKNLKLHFAYDFDRYWFEPLADVFGISAQQVEELARQTLLNDWHIKITGEYISDPRDDLWRSHRHERETWHSHYSYPKADDYRFYLSYHAMLAVAAKLLNEMPVVHRYDDDKNKWLDWLNGHSLTRTDGRWLADRRDPAPLQRRVWLQEKKTDDWRWEIKSDDFLEGLLLECDGETWLNVAGHWNDNDSSAQERFSIASALISPATASSLLNALSTCSNSRGYKLPDYQEEFMESKIQPFELLGWLYCESTEKSLDQFDPYAGDMDYPPYKIGEAFIEQFNFTADLGQREWHLPDTNKASLVCELWSEKINTYRDTPTRHGNRMAASLTFLKKLCADSKRELIIEVQIERSYLPNSYNPRKDDEIEYPFPYCKIFILSANGTIRDTRTRYQLR